MSTHPADPEAFLDTLTPRLNELGVWVVRGGLLCVLKTGPHHVCTLQVGRQGGHLIASLGTPMTATWMLPPAALADALLDAVATELLLGPLWQHAGAQLMSRETFRRPDTLSTHAETRAAHGGVLYGVNVTSWGDGGPPASVRVGVLDDPALHGTWLAATAASALRGRPPFPLTEPRTHTALEALAAVRRWLA